MEHIGNYDHCYTSILMSLRTLLMYTDYNYTFSCLSRSLQFYCSVAVVVVVVVVVAAAVVVAVA